MGITTHQGSPVDLLLGGQVLIVGVEDDPSSPEVLRVYVGARYKNVYFTLDDPEDIERVRNAWAGGNHLYMPADHLPPLIQGDSTPPREQEAKK